MNKKTEKFIISFFLILIVLYMVLSLRSEMAWSIRLGKRVNILLVGCDELAYSKHSDVLILVSYEPSSKFLDILSVPRDTKVPCAREVSWRQYRKINEVYSSTFLKTRDIRQSALEVKKKLEEFLDIEIPFYFQVDYNSFRSVIDVLGGIEMDIESKMDYDDNWGNLHIHFKPGRQVLNGQKALEYIRFRDRALGDTGRILRQHRFLKALAGKLKNPFVLFRMGRLYRAVAENVHTNIRIWDILVFAVDVRNMGPKDLRIQNLPGTDENIAGKDYWIVDNPSKEEIIQVILNSYRMGTKAFKPHFSYEAFDRNIVVEVWNASRREGLAYNVQRRLRKYNIDTVRWGNFGVYKKYTTVIDRCGDIDLAYKVARVMGGCEVKTEIDRARLVDLSVVIGEDFERIGDKTSGF